MLGSATGPETAGVSHRHSDKRSRSVKTRGGRCLDGNMRLLVLFNIDRRRHQLQNLLADFLLVALENRGF